LVQLVQVAARQRGRPFNGVLELLPNPDEETEDDQSVKLSPEEQLLRDLVNLAMTIRDDGQVNPLTVVDVSQGATRLYRIETGERRYWATWLLRDFMPGYEGDGMIPCIVIPAERASVFRQAKENTARTGLSAIAMARQAALLLLTVHGYEIPDYPVTHDFYRQALELDLRGKREYTDGVLAAMGGIGKMHFSRYKGLLKLSDEALELADRHNIDERRLRPLLTLPPEHHAELVRQIIDFNLTSRQVEELCSGDSSEDGDDANSNDIPAPARKIAKVTQATNSTLPQDIARALVQQEGDVSLARARLQALRKLLSDAERYLTD
jgi:ParB-like chromosome segregation protein Spo0J